MNENIEKLKMQAQDRACVLEAILKYMLSFEISEFRMETPSGVIEFKTNKN